MEKKRPQLSPDELLRVKWLLGGLVVLVALSAVFYLDIDAWLLTGLTTAGVIAVLVRPAWPARWPALLHRLAFPVIVAVFIGDLYVTAEVLPALVRLDLLLLLYRGVSYRQRRDDLQLIVLGLFLIVLAGVLSVSLLFAVQILAFIACALVFLLLVTLAAATPGAATPAGTVPAWARGPWRPVLRRVRAATDWRVVLLGGGLFAGLVAVSALLFLAIPRFELENSLFLERFMTRKARTGFSDHIRFGDVTDIRQDNGVAASIDVTDPAAVPARPYWRMVVLDEYRDASFRLSPALRRAAFDRERSEVQVRGRARPRPGPPVAWTVYLEAGVSRYLPLAGPFEFLRFRERQNFATASGLGVVALRDEPVSMTAYRVTGMQPGAPLSDPSFAAEWRQARARGRDADLPVLQLSVDPEDRSRLGRVVAEFGGDGLAAAAFAERAAEWLARHHAYSLQSRTPPGAGDTLVRWLLSGEPGHCELFAGSLVLLAREAGIPARLVTGFKGGAWNGYSNSLTLRNADAHAWCELFDGATQCWLRADPTPGSGTVDASGAARADEAGRRVDRSWGARLESLRVFWYRRIVSFDQQSQVETLQAVKSTVQDLGQRIRGWLGLAGERLRGWLLRPWDWRRGLAWSAAALLAGAAVWFGRRLPARWWRGRGAGADGLQPVRREAAWWLRRFRGREPAAELRGELERLRFGPPAGGPEAARVFAQARREWRRLRRLPGRPAAADR